MPKINLTLVFNMVCGSTPYMATHVVRTSKGTMRQTMHNLSCVGIDVLEAA